MSAAPLGCHALLMGRRGDGQGVQIAAWPKGSALSTSTVSSARQAQSSAPSLSACCARVCNLRPCNTDMDPAKARRGLCGSQGWGVEPVAARRHQQHAEQHQRAVMACTPSVGAPEEPARSAHSAPCPRCASLGCTPARHTCGSDQCALKLRQNRRQPPARLRAACRRRRRCLLPRPTRTAPPAPPLISLCSSAPPRPSTARTGPQTRARRCVQLPAGAEAGGSGRGGWLSAPGCVPSAHSKPSLSHPPFLGMEQQQLTHRGRGRCAGLRVCAGAHGSRGFAFQLHHGGCPAVLPWPC